MQSVLVATARGQHRLLSSGPGDKIFQAALVAARDLDSLPRDSTLPDLKAWAQQHAMSCGYKQIGVMLYGSEAR